MAADGCVRSRPAQQGWSVAKGSVVGLAGGSYCNGVPGLLGAGVVQGVGYEQPLGELRWQLVAFACYSAGFEE